MAAAGAHQFAVDSDGVAILLLTSESDSSEVVHAFTTGASGVPPVEAPVAVTGPAQAAALIPTPLAAVAPPSLDWDMDGAPLEAAGGQPTPADLDQGAAAPAPAPVPFLVPEHLLAVDDGGDGSGGGDGQSADE